VSEVSEERREARPGDGASSGGGSTLGMKVENLSAFYGSFKAVTDVSMDIQANKVTALIGPSGCGKSTYIRCLNRMHEVSPGRGPRAASRSGSRTSTPRTRTPW